MEDDEERWAMDGIDRIYSSDDSRKSVFDHGISDRLRTNENTTFSFHHSLDVLQYGDAFIIRPVESEKTELEASFGECKETLT